MEAKIKIGEFEGKVEVERGEATIKSEECDFGVALSKMNGKFYGEKGVREIRVSPGHDGPDLYIGHEDGREIHICNDVYNDGLLVVNRLTWKENRRYIVDQEYLTKDMKWVPDNSGLGPLPADALRIDLFGFAGKIRTEK